MMMEKHGERVYKLKFTGDNMKDFLKQLAIVLSAILLGFYCLMWIVAEGFAM